MKNTGIRRIILMVLQGLILLAILSSLFSTVANLFFSTLVENGINGELFPSEDASEPDLLPDAAASESSGPESSENLSAPPQELFQASLVSMQSSAVLMWLSMALLFLMIALTARNEWKRNLFRYGIGALLFAACAVLFLAAESGAVYLLTAVLHGLALAADHAFSIVKNHKARNAAFRAVCILLLGLVPFFAAKDALAYVLTLTFPRIFWYIARIAFSRVRTDVLRKILRKTYAAEILFGMVLLITAFSIILPKFELNIPTFGDALWYCFAIVTTIGFGDLTAVTLPGRIISVILGLYGLIVVALITSIIVNFYNETRNAGDRETESPEH